MGEFTFVILDFEGSRPDQSEELSGRVGELCAAITAQGHSVHVIFPGDPHLAVEETRRDGRLTLHRWRQWTSTHQPGRADKGEEALSDFTGSAPQFVVEQLAPLALAQGRILVVMGEAWRTAEAMCAVSDLLWQGGLREQAVLLWNASDTMGFGEINWGRLAYTTTITTISRYMKHLMWEFGVNPLVIPNGVPRNLLGPLDWASAEELRASLAGQQVLLKVAPWDPDEQWGIAVDTTALLKAAGGLPRLVARGGPDARGDEMLTYARAMNLEVRDVYASVETPQAYAQAFAQALPADVLNVTSPMSPDVLRLLYCSCDAVLANRGREPCGPVALEAMAAGGVAFTGSTGEEYVRHLENAIVLETEDPREVAWYVDYLGEHPAERTRLREAARATAERYSWEHVVHELLAKVAYLAAPPPNDPSGGS